MAPVVGIGERYATQVGALWSGLARTLFELEQLAADPVQLDEEDSLELLRRLQYRLHSASERAYGFAPPAGIESVHDELAAALAAGLDRPRSRGRHRRCLARSRFHHWPATPARVP